MKKVMVAGGAGFVGRHSLSHLAAMGYEVHVIDIRNLSEIYPNIIWHQCDLNNHKECCRVFARVQPHFLLNFAWFTKHGEYWSSKYNFVSVKNSFHLLKCFAENGGKRVVMAGTCAEYEWGNSVCNEENTTLKPHTIYGQSKLAMYNLLNAYANAFELSWAWGRLFFLFGPQENRKRFVASIISKLLSGKEAPCSHGNQIRDFMCTIDAGEAFARLLVSPLEGAINIATGKPLSLKEIGHKIETITQQKDLIKFGIIPSSKNEPANITADTTRLNQELGWQPSATIEQRLQQTIDWWKNNV
jgi:nucleoside-diphosphate-sugar epimerase